MRRIGKQVKNLHGSAAVTDDEAFHQLTARAKSLRNREDEMQRKTPESEYQPVFTHQFQKIRLEKPFWNIVRAHSNAMRKPQGTLHEVAQDFFIKLDNLFFYIKLEIFQ